MIIIIIIRFLFQLMWCLFNAVEMEQCSSYDDNYNCFGIMVKKIDKKEKCVVECCTDSTRVVVFLSESTNLSDSPFFYPLHPIIFLLDNI